MFIPAQGNLSKVAFSWLLQLRWGALICQAVLLLAVYLFFRIDIPLPLVIAIISFEAGSNIYFFFLQRRSQDIPSSFFGLIMFLDLMLLTALLYYTGGAMNPFTFLFLVHVTIGAMLMRPLWSWGLTTFSICCYGLLFLLPSAGEGYMLGSGESNQAVCVDFADIASQQVHLAIHLRGMWAAYAITALFIVFFVSKIQQGLEERQETIARLKEEKLRSEKLASLATLAAGAAHEFSTPLATIAVAAGEMIYTAQKDNLNPDLLSDAKLIREQVQRCREILFQMSADAGEHLGESHEMIAVNEFIEAIIADLGQDFSHKIDFDNRVNGLRVYVPYRSLYRAIKGVLRNSIDSSAPEMPITISSWADDEFICFEVTDHGCGMDAATMAKAGEPFFTSKAPGKGLGLGLFLTKSMAERYGGDLHISSEQGQGTKVRLRLSRAQVKL